MPVYSIRVYADYIVEADNVESACDTAEEKHYEALGVEGAFFSFPVVSCMWEEIDE